MLRETALNITPLVTELFNISIRLGELPDEWKASHVSPIPKSDNHSDPAWKLPSNIIELLLILSKLLEKHICDIISYLPTLKSTIQSLHSSEDLLVESVQLELYWMLQTSGLENWNRVMTSALYFLITVKLLIQFHAGLCYKSFKITVFTDRS